MWFYIHTLWLFTASDITSVVLPGVAVGFASAISGPILTTNLQPSIWVILSRLPLVFCYNWLNLLILSLDNQLQPQSIPEDALNKPWRPLPSRRLSAAEAKVWLFFTIPTVFAATKVLGGTREAVTHMILTWMYNDLGGADMSFVARNIMNVGGILCYVSGSMVVTASYDQYQLNSAAPLWLVVLGCTILTTVHLQDMPDIEGDAKRGRQTVPLVCGDCIARISIAGPVLFWSLFCPSFWHLGVWGYMVPVSLALVIATRLFWWREIVSDRKTWKCWCLWISTIYFLPLVKRFQISV